MILDSVQNMVEDFHKMAGHPVGDYANPKPLTEERKEKRINWILEEVNEELREAKTLVDQADATIDAIYYLVGCLVEMGVHGDILFRMVHEANMRKQGAGWNADTKQIKPEGWVGPEEEMQRYFNTLLEDEK